MTKHTIDAKNKKLGRVASEAAHILLGKKTPDFTKNQVADVEVHITNTAQADIDPKKLKNKEYTSFSGHPGGLKVRTMEKVVEKKGYSEVFRKAVYGMLPSNKLRARMMKRLIISE